MSELVHITEAQPAHHNFIKSTWLKSFFLGKASFCENLTPGTFYYEHASLVERCLKRAKVLIAESKDSPDVAIGYVCYEPEVIHYIYVRHQFKRFGIGRALLAATGINTEKFSITHRTRDCAWAVSFIKRQNMGDGTFKRELILGKYPKGVYNPYLFLRMED